MGALSSPEGTPIEVWLTQKNMEVTCMIVREDETITTLTVESLSMRGGQREITSYMIEHGYTPSGRWEVEADDNNGGGETLRRFKPAQKS